MDKHIEKELLIGNIALALEKDHEDLPRVTVSFVSCLVFASL